MARFPARAWFLLRRGVESLVDTAGTREAAQVAFFALLTFPGALLLAVWGASTILDDQSVRLEIVDGIVDAMPLTESEGRAEVEDLLDDVADGAGTLGLIGGLSLIWSSSGAIGALRHAIGAAWPTGEPLPYFQGKALDVVMTVVIVPLALAALGLNLLNIAPTVFDGAPVLEGLVSFAITEVVPALAVLGLFLILFRVLPPAEASWRAAWSGALVAFAGVLIVRYATELYFGTIGETSAVYGAIAGLLAVSIAVYLLAVVAVLGANVAAESARHGSWESVDAAVEEGSGGESSIWRDAWEAVRSLFIRARRGSR